MSSGNGSTIVPAASDLSHAFGAAFDNPDLLVTCVVGDGEAETGPLATGWHSNKFLNPVRDGAVLPVLHLNGYKIANPTVLARTSDADLAKLFEGPPGTALIEAGCGRCHSADAVRDGSLAGAVLIISGIVCLAFAEARTAEEEGAHAPDVEAGVKP